jgi:prevent-host-death family protein
MKIAPLAEVKDRLSAYIDAARESAIIVTRNGKPVALLTPILEDDDLDSLLLAHDRKFIRLLEQGPRPGARRPFPDQRAVLAGPAASASSTRDGTDVAAVGEAEPSMSYRARYPRPPRAGTAPDPPLASGRRDGIGRGRRGGREPAARGSARARAPESWPRKP